MSKYGNENAANGGRNKDTASRDRAYGGGGGFGGGGTGGGGLGFGGGRTASVIGNRFGAPSASAQAAARARNAPTNAPYGGQGGLNARRSVNPTPSYEMSLRNMYELSKMMPGPGMAIRAGLGIAGTGLGPNFSGSTGMVNGPGDYDPTNRFGTNGSTLFPNQPGQMMPARPNLPAIQGPQQPQGLGMSNMGPMNFGYQPFNGMQGSQWTRPGYNFIGGPGQPFPGKPLGPVLPRTPRSTGFR